MGVRKLKGSWQYDFKLSEHPRQRKAGFRTKSEAQHAERQARERLIRGVTPMTLAEAYREFVRVSRSSLKVRTLDHYEHLWTRIEPVLGHLLIEQIKTETLERFVEQLTGPIENATKNKHLVLIRTLLRFAWKRGKLDRLPYVPMLKTAKTSKEWYSKAERDRLLDEIYDRAPHWYLFFYLTCRLGLRVGEVYAISRDRVREDPALLRIDRQVQRGTKDREAMLATRKNNEDLTLPLPADVLKAIRWHIDHGFAGPEFLFSMDGSFPRYLDSHKGVLRRAQRAAGLRQLGHHAIGRHSVASQAASSGESLRVIQAQLGQRSIQSTEVYAKVASYSQLRLVEGLAPAAPRHVNVVSTKSEAV